MSLNSSEPKTCKKKWHTIGQMNVDNLWFDLCWTCVAFGLLILVDQSNTLVERNGGLAKKWLELGHK